LLCHARGQRPHRTLSGFVLDITEKKRSEDEMRRRNRELNALNAMAVIATQSFDLDEILNLTLRQYLTVCAKTVGLSRDTTDVPTGARRLGRAARRARACGSRLSGRLAIW